MVDAYLLIPKILQQQFLCCPLLSFVPSWAQFNLAADLCMTAYIVGKRYKCQTHSTRFHVIWPGVAPSFVIVNSSCQVFVQPCSVWALFQNVHKSRVGFAGTLDSGAELRWHLDQQLSPRRALTPPPGVTSLIIDKPCAMSNQHCN